MGVRIAFIGENEKAGVAQVRTKFPANMVSKGTEIDQLLDTIDAIYVVPYMMSSGGTVGRSAIGPGYDIVRVRDDDSGTEAERKILKNFFEYQSPDVSNFKSVFGPLAKIYTTAFAFRMLGTAAWEVIRDGMGKPLGFDVIPGVLKPNVEPDGRFKSPAYIQYLRSGNLESKSEFVNPEDVIYFAVPDISSRLFLSESIALGEYTLPSEIYAARAYLSLHENRNTPYSGFWYVPENTSDDVFDKFQAVLNSQYTGSGNYGKNPIVMKGKGGFQYIGPSKDDAPYVEGREINRKEIAGVTGVPGPKYGVDLDNMNISGMREVRREFYESVLKPVSNILEEGIYFQVSVRLFGITGWAFAFHRPDFTTAIEDASISMRRIQWGEWSPNEARVARGEKPRENGDYYLLPSNMSIQGEEVGRPEEPDISGDEGDMKPGEEDPVPGSDKPVDVGAEESLRELDVWKRFALRVAKGQRYNRDFRPDHIPVSAAEIIRELIEEAGDDEEKIREVFDFARESLKND